MIKFWSPWTTLTPGCFLQSLGCLRANKGVCYFCGAQIHKQTSLFFLKFTSPWTALRIFFGRKTPRKKKKKKLSSLRLKGRGSRGESCHIRFCFWLLASHFFFFALWVYLEPKKKDQHFLKNGWEMVLSIPIFWHKKKMWNFHWSSNPFEQTGWNVFSGYQVYRTGGEISPPPFFKVELVGTPGTPNRLVTGAHLVASLTNCTIKLTHGAPCNGPWKRWTLPTYYVHPGSNQQKSPENWWWERWQFLSKWAFFSGDMLIFIGKINPQELLKVSHCLSKFWILYRDS